MARDNMLYIIVLLTVALLLYNIIAGILWIDSGDEALIMILSFLASHFIADRLLQTKAK